MCLSLKSPGIKANSIYFTDDYFQGYYESPYGSCDNGRCSLEDESIKQTLKTLPFGLHLHLD